FDALSQIFIILFYHVLGILCPNSYVYTCYINVFDHYNFFVKIGNKAEVHSHRTQYDLTTLYYKLITNLVIIYENTGNIAILNVQLFYFFIREAMEILLLLSLPF